MPDAQLGMLPGRWQGWWRFLPGMQIAIDQQIAHDRDLIPAHLQENAQQFGAAGNDVFDLQPPFTDPLLVQVEIAAQQQ